MKRLDGKRILKDAVHGLIPENVIRRPKKGFGMPVGAWLNGPLAPLLDDVLSADALRDAGIFDAAYVARMIAEHRNGAADHRKPLWTLLVFELWRRANGVAPCSA
jgi:asparagine synthase (glutamine-hydrolysing)